MAFEVKNLPQKLCKNEGLTENGNLKKNHQNRQRSRKKLLRSRKNRQRNVVKIFKSSSKTNQNCENLHGNHEKSSKLMKIMKTGHLLRNFIFLMHHIVTIMSEESSKTDNSA